MQKEFYGGSVQLALTAGTSWQIFLEAGLLQEAKEELTKAVKIDEKVGNYHNEGLAYVSKGRVLEVWGKTEEALATSLKAVSALEKTDGVRRQDRICADLARLYAKLGDLVRAEEYINQLDSLVPTTVVGDPHGLLNKRDKVRSQAVFFAATNRWKEAYQSLDEALEIAKKVPMYPMFSQVVVRTDYIWVLKRHGRIEEAKVHLEEIQRLYDEVDRRFAALDIEANLLAPRNVIVGKEFDVRFDVFNVSRKTGFLVKAEKMVPFEFDFVSSPTDHSMKNGSVDLKGEKIGPFELKTIKLRIKAPHAGSFNLNPEVIYRDDSGEVRTCKSNNSTLTVKPDQPTFVTLPGRIPTGFEDLDALLYGGLPEKHAVALVAPSLEERELIINKFLSTGAKSGEPTFFVTLEPRLAKELSEKYPSNFFLLICSPQADAQTQILPNIITLKGIESLTAIDIELVKAIRTLKTTDANPKRICLGIVSDALLQHHAVTTRRWLSALLPTLKSKGFTILSVIDSQMHPVEELQAVLSMFDGELRILERETGKEIEKVLTVRRMYNQKYVEKDLLLTKERMQK
jgi:KaiC/GvpD/RAD55 family RecA-like ATPase/tetratricopeptide (TPR) repeat protein